MDIENKQSEVLGNSTFKRRAGASTGDQGCKYEVKLLMLYLLHGLSNKIDFWLYQFPLHVKQIDNNRRKAIMK